MAAGERLSVAGPVGGSILAGGRVLELNASVGGDLKFSGESLRLGPEAEVTGSAHFEGPEEPEREFGAPDVEWTQPEPDEDSLWDNIAGVIARWGMGLTLGVVLVLLASGPLGAMAAIGGRPIAPLLLGLLLFVGLPFAAILLAITFIGLPLAFATAMLYLFLLFASRVVAGMVIGQALLGPRLHEPSADRADRPRHRNPGPGGRDPVRGWSDRPAHDVLRPRRLRALGVALAPRGDGFVGSRVTACGGTRVSAEMGEAPGWQGA